MEFSLRPATVDDLQTLFEMEARIQIAPWTLDHFASELTKPYSRVLVLTDDDTDSVIAGYIVFWLMAEDCEILNLGIDLGHRGLGLGRMMIRKSISLAIHEGAKKAHLDVRKSNEAALQLYQDVGFEITHIRKAFYTGGEDAYHMVLEWKETSEATP